MTPLHSRASGALSLTPAEPPLRTGVDRSCYLLTWATTPAMLSSTRTTQENGKDRLWAHSACPHGQRRIIWPLVVDSVAFASRWHDVVPER